ncbi:MAG: DUF402 domain-containing protein [Nocardioides sp.]
MTLDLGAVVRIEMTKWVDSPHWSFDALWLGRDMHGDWVGIPAGTFMSRPGADYVSPVAQVGLSPASDLDERGWLATFHAPRGQVAVYVDITAPPVWDGATLRAVDLDLDVVRGTTGRVWVDDEDEFAEHRVSLGYPDELAQAAMASCDHVHALVLGCHAPYDGSHEVWLHRLAELTSRS